MSILPPEVRAGYVYNRVLRAIGDRPEDVDRFPDGIPAKGTVTFTPKNSVKQVVSNDTGVTVTREPVTCTIHQGENQPDDPDPTKGGLLIDEAGAVGGVWLVVGEWTVSYQFDDRYSNVPNQDIVVTEDHTENNPLDVALVAGLTPSPTIKFVVNEQIYIDSKNYRDEALGFRNEAQEAFEQFTWPVQVQDTPPENTDVIWVNPDEPAGTASDWALRAEAAAATLGDVGGLHVDTSVGTRVFVGDTMIYGDTGWRDISNLLDEEWVVERNFLMRRENSTITLVASIERASDASESQLNRSTNLLNTENSRLPEGFRPYLDYNYFAFAQTFNGFAINLSAVGHRDNLQLRALGAPSSATISPGDVLWFTTYWQTDDPWPTSLPGTPR